MVGAYILIQTELGKAAEVARALRGIDGVASAEVLTGPYDVIVRAEAETLDQIAVMVESELDMVGGIGRTLTCPVVNPVTRLASTPI